MIDQVPGPGIKGGVKQRWIREHQAMILDCLDVLGAEKTMQLFTLSRPTLNRIVREGSRDRLPANDKEVILRYVASLNEEITENRREINDMKKDYNQFTAVVADNLAKNFFEPLLKSAIKLPEGYKLPELRQDPLSIEGFDLDTKKYRLHSQK